MAAALPQRDGGARCNAAPTRLRPGGRRAAIAASQPPREACAPLARRQHLLRHLCAPAAVCSRPHAITALPVQPCRSHVEACCIPWPSPASCSLINIPDQY